MPRFPAWKWMVSGFGGTRSGAEPAGRPCLPSVEKLDQRVLLSGSPAASTEEGVPVVVEGLIEDGVNGLKAEFAALSTLNGANLDHKQMGEVADLGHEFLKLDQVLVKYGQDILELKVGPDQQNDVAHKVNDILLKIQDLAGDLNLSTDGLLLPAVQVLADGSVRLLDDLNALQQSGLVGQIPTADLEHYVKIGGDFLKIDQALIDYKADVIMGAPIDDAMKTALDKTKVEFLKITLEDAVISSANQVPPDFLNGIQGEIDGLITGGNTVGGTGGGDTLV